LGPERRHGPKPATEAQAEAMGLLAESSRRAYRELVTRGARVIVVSVASRPHREYARAGLRSYVSLRELWGEALLAAIHEAAEPSQPAVGQ